MTQSGNEPATFRLVVQCLNQLRHRVPLWVVKGSDNEPCLTGTRIELRDSYKSTDLNLKVKANVEEGHPVSLTYD